MSPLVKKYLCCWLVRFLVPIPPWISEAFGKRVPVNLQFCDLAQEREQARIRVDVTMREAKNSPSQRRGRRLPWGLHLPKDVEGVWPGCFGGLGCGGASQLLVTAHY